MLRIEFDVVHIKVVFAWFEFFNKVDFARNLWDRREVERKITPVFGRFKMKMFWSDGNVFYMGEHVFLAAFGVVQMGVWCNTDPSAFVVFGNRTVSEVHFGVFGGAFDSQ